MATEIVIIVVIVVIVFVIYGSKFLYKTRFKEEKVHSE